MTESGWERRIRFSYIVFFTAFALVGPATTLLESRTVDWLWLGVGAVLFGVSFGPFARTATADRIDRIAGEPGLQKVIGVVLMATAIWSAIAGLQPSAVTLGSFVVGGLSAFLVVKVVKQISV